MFPDHTNKFTQLLKSPEFQQLIKTDATTSNGQQLVAEYFAVDDVWASKKQTNTVQAYYELLCLVKTHSTKDSIWFLFWEEMHRHAAIIMTLLYANIFYNTNNCYVPTTLEIISFHDYIKQYTNPGPCPIEIIQHIFDGTNREAKMLKTCLNVMAYTPTKTEMDINKLMEVMRIQSPHVSKNILSSAARTLSTTLNDWLKQCSGFLITSVPVTKLPRMLHTFKLQMAMNEKTYHNTKTKKGVEDNSEFNWFPECINNAEWTAFLANPFEVNKLQRFLRTCLQSGHKQDDSQGIMPSYRITFKSITSDVLPIKNGVQKIDVCHINAYQIIPGIMYTLQARLNRVLVKTILNEVDVKRAIEYVIRCVCVCVSDLQ